MIEIVDTGSNTWDDAIGTPHYYHKGKCDPHTEQLSIELAPFLHDLVNNARPEYWNE